MFKLTVVGGPAKGAAYSIKDGENSIGRVSGNDIVLTSQKVSKKHCVLVVDNTGVNVKDAGSSNGTFVNGVLTKTKKLNPGDRVSVGEFVLELSKVESARKNPGGLQLVDSGMIGGSQNIPGIIPSQTKLTSDPHFSAAPNVSSPIAAAPPQTLQEKVQFYFEKYILNFVYNLNETHEWKSLMSGMFILMAGATAVLSVFPILDRVNEKLSREAENRALVLARQIVERNAPFVYEKLETKVDVGFIEKEHGVTGAYLIDMEGRVMAPGRKLNQYLTEAHEASFSAQARAAFQNKDTLERKTAVFGDIVAVAAPMKIFNSTNGSNIPVALGVVFFDRSLILFDSGTEALSYIQAIILSAIVAVIMFFSLYRLTLRPLTALNEDIDHVLKGNKSSVEKRFKMEEIEPLIDVVNAALSRVGGGASGGASGGSDAIGVDDFIQTIRLFSEKSTDSGVMIFNSDKKIQFISPFMEELSGIRDASAQGSDITAVARDAAFVAFVEDALARAPLLGQIVGQEVPFEDFEFSGTNYKLRCVAIGQSGQAIVRAYVLTAVKVL